MQILNILIYLLTLGCLKVRIVERELLPCVPFQKKKSFRATHCCLLKVRQEPLFAGCTGPLLPRTDFCCCAGLHLVAASVGCSLAVVPRLPVQVASLVVEHRP